MTDNYEVRDAIDKETLSRLNPLEVHINMGSQQI